MARWHIILIGLIGFIGFPMAGASSEFAITASVIAGGGGRSSGDGFYVKGTIGQAAPGVLFGESLELEAGFWNRASDAPTLHYAVSDDGLTLFWASELIGFILDFTDSLNPPVVWNATTQVPEECGGLKRVIVQTDSAAGFYRLRQP